MISNFYLRNKEEKMIIFDDELAKQSARPLSNCYAGKRLSK